jgi:hypothetical protein
MGSTSNADIATIPDPNYNNIASIPSPNWSAPHVQPQPANSMAVVPKSINTVPRHQVLSENIDSLQNNLNNLTQSLGLTEDDLNELDNMDVDSFLENYLEWDEHDMQPAVSSKELTTD